MEQRISIQLEYDKNRREVLRKFGNGTSETTLYDRAGRVTVKAQNSARGELVWAEGYLYGSDGKCTATVDNKGAVTLYEYNSKGQLSTVYYPYTQEMINLLKSEAEENNRYNNVLIFKTGYEQDLMIAEKARNEGEMFGDYKLLTNNCSQHASKALAAGGIDTTQLLIPNMARNYVKKHNKDIIESEENWHCKRISE